MSQFDRPIPDSAPLSRRERKKRETRMRILEAAFELMAERGYDDVTIEEISNRADIANATFFLHFPTKAALIDAFNEHVADVVKERLSGFSAGALEELELLRAIILDEWSQRSVLLRQIMADAASQNSGALIGTNASLMQLAEDIIRSGQASGELSSDYDPEIIAQCLMAGWSAAATQWAKSGDDDEARRANRQTLDLILYGAANRSRFLVD